MKTIRILCDAWGESKVIDNRNLVFSNENETIKLIITYPSELNTYRKRIDIYVDYDKSLDYFENSTNSDTLEFELQAEHLKQGIIKIQPIAYLVEGGVTYLDSTKQKWKALKFEVQYSVNASESTTNVDTPLGQQLELRIDALERAIPRMSKLSDVYINDLQDGDIIKWNSITQRWENKPL